MLNTAKIKGRMKELGFTQADMSKMLGLNPSSLNRKINDSSGKFLSLDEAKKMADILNIDDPEEYFFYSSLANTQEAKH